MKKTESNNSLATFFNHSQAMRVKGKYFDVTKTVGHVPNKFLYMYISSLTLLMLGGNKRSCVLKPTCS